MYMNKENKPMGLLVRHILRMQSVIDCLSNENIACIIHECHDILSSIISMNSGSLADKASGKRIPGLEFKTQTVHKIFALY